MADLDTELTELTEHTDPLLRVIHRVAHREHLHSSIRPTQFTRRRPVTGTVAHAALGTTARKGNWS